MPAVDARGEQRLTAEEFLAADPGDLAARFGGPFELVDGLVVRCQAQSRAHDRVIHRLRRALENAHTPNDPCLDTESDTPVRFPDADSASVDRRANFRFPDLLVIDCGRWDATTVLPHIRMVVEVVSPDSIGDDTEYKRKLYARTGIPVYLVVHFADDWETVERIDEFRLDWSNKRYGLHREHWDELALEEPIKLQLPFTDLDGVRREK
ncbi:Uma2 family endonuclease [Nocardia sp. CC227C]|uniref:Uma2 family endonuclease n=1 Tax=Nocardia sp. CC227C TaxID=3044562 RepID=UPI00278BCB02|nr:Uma2 family endonuclease [Nocardia sp. CC227C]